MRGQLGGVREETEKRRTFRRGSDSSARLQSGLRHEFASRTRGIRHGGFVFCFCYFRCLCVCVCVLVVGLSVGAFVCSVFVVVVVGFA